MVMPSLNVLVHKPTLKIKFLKFALLTNLQIHSEWRLKIIGVLSRSDRIKKDKAGSCADGNKCLDWRYILKVETQGLTNVFDGKYERKRKVNAFGLNN